MTPTDEIRAKLDELGIEWWQRKFHTCWKIEKEQGTEHWRAWPAPDGTVTLKVDAIYGLTPEQAIAATVGAGTCHLEECEHEREIPYDLPECDGGWYTEVTHDCDECGYENTDPNVRFCGGCGRRVVSE